MSFYWFNREKLLKNAWDKYHNTIKEENKRLLSIMLKRRCKK